MDRDFIVDEDGTSKASSLSDRVEVRFHKGMLIAMQE